MLTDLFNITQVVSLYPVNKGEEDYFSCVQYHHTMGVTGEDSQIKGSHQC